MIFFFISMLASVAGTFSSIQFDLGTPQFSFTISNALMQTLSDYWHLVVIFLILLLAISWFQNLRALKRHRRKQQEAGAKPNNLPSMSLMAFITVFTLIVAFSPYFMDDFFASPNVPQEPNPSNFTETTMTVHGMTCGGCETLIIKQVGGLPGVESVIASHQREEVVVVYDNQMVNLGNIAQTIENAGYTVVME